MNFDFFFSISIDSVIIKLNQNSFGVRSYEEACLNYAVGQYEVGQWIITLEKYLLTFENYVSLYVV